MRVFPFGDVESTTRVSSQPTLAFIVFVCKGLQFRQHGSQAFDRLHQDHIFRTHFLVCFSSAKIQEPIFDQNRLELLQALSQCASSTTFSAIFLKNCFLYFLFVADCTAHAMLLFPLFAHVVARVWISCCGNYEEHLSMAVTSNHIDFTPT